MPAAARGNSFDKVLSKTGTGKFCSKPVKTTTGTCSTDVFINGIGAVRQGDIVAPHAFGGCVPDVSPLTICSTKVFINGRGAGRIGDKYTPDNIITSGSTNVFFG